MPRKAPLRTAVDAVVLRIELHRPGSLNAMTFELGEQ
jgi:hypothetical protein